MSSEHEAIILRNDSPSISYIGKWIPIQASTVAGFGTLGPAFSPTLHSTTTSGGFSLLFNGSVFSSKKIEVVSFTRVIKLTYPSGFSINVLSSLNVTNTSAQANPSWNCFVDGISIGSVSLPGSPENNWTLCGLGNIPNGAHELTVNITSHGMPFYLDSIQYRSSPTVSLENSYILIDNFDPAIDYISGWGPIGTVANQTTDPNSLVNVTFIGTQISWYGYIPTEEPHNASSGQYSVDGGPFAPFTLAGLPVGSPTIYNQVFFTTPALDMRTHVLSVKYTGRPGLTPLVLDYLVVMNGSFTASSTSSARETETRTSNPTPLYSLPAAPKSSSTTRIVGEIVGPIIGVVAVVAVIYILFKYYRKQKQTDRTDSVDSYFPIPVPPLQVSQRQKNSVQQTPSNPSNPTLSSVSSSQNNQTHTQLPLHSNVIINPNSLSSTSLFWMLSSQNNLKLGGPSMLDETDASQRPVSAIAHVSLSNTQPSVPIRYDNSGIPLIPELIVIEEEIGNPPVYTEQ